MKKPTIHFVYTVPLGTNIFRRGVDKILKIFHITPLHRSGRDFFIPWKHPIRAPHSISYNLLRAFKETAKGKYKVKFYGMYEKGAVNLGPNDIFIGTPAPEGGLSYSGRPDKDDYSSVTSATLRKYKGSAHQKILITPFADDKLLVSWMKDLAENYATKIILSATGEIWTRNWERTPFGSIPKEKVLRINMGIDMNDYPFVKRSFNPKGKRKYFYIGHNAWYKNTVELERIAEAIPNFDGVHIGCADVKGWKKLSNFANLTPDFMAKLAEEYDIFVNTSTADAQATTILENMCFGFVVACTPQSGYEYPSLFSLSTNDTKSNVATLEKIQNMDEEELLDLAKKNKEIARTGHSWPIITRDVLDFIGI